jgi:aryl-alcohol dehydrogenase-like predicted oxidoreductase
MGHNELLLARALREKKHRALLSVKFGALRGPDGAWLGMDMRPAAIKTALAYSLVRLGVDHVDIYRPARLDPSVPIEDTVGAIADLVKQGYVRFIGLSEVGPETIARASAVHPIVDLQIEYSIISRGPEARIFPLLDKLGIAVTAYGVFSRGLLTGSKPTGSSDMRAHLPRFTGDNAAKNQRVVQALASLAHERGVTPAQLALAWVLSKGHSIVPVVGARTPKQLTESLDALAIHLSADEIARIGREVPASAVAGTRYQQVQMDHLDSERG